MLEAIARWQQRPLVYGSSDCCQFAAFVVHELTGRDHMNWNYSSELEALEILAKHGGLSEVVSAELGPSIPAHELVAGDVALVHWDNELALGIQLAGARVAVIATGGRLHDFPSRKTVVHGWSTCRN